MSTRNISWEIVLAGIAFIGIGIYLFNQNSSVDQSSSSASVNTASQAPKSPSEPSLPGAIVIDLENLESLQNLENLKSLKNLGDLKNLEIELKNLDKIIEKHTQNGQIQKSLNQSLQQLEKELQKIESGDYKVKLQDQKVYINKDYNVSEAQWTETSPGVYVFRESFSVSDLESMDLKLGFGNLNIVGNGAEKGNITLRATGDLQDPANFSEKLQIKKSLSAPNATFQVSPSESSSISDQINLEATLTLPKTAKIVAHTSGGHINASHMRNNQHFETSGGHISLTAVEGETIAETNGGHITGDQVSGNTQLKTGGGHIKVDQSNGSLTAKTGGGHIEIQDTSGDVMAKTSGGNISAVIKEATGPLKFFTSAGNVSLHLPENIAADLDVSGSSVHLSDAFNFSGTENKGSISGSINDGGLPVVIKCGYGNVNINTSQ